MVDVCCLQEVRWKGTGFKDVWNEGKIWVVAVLKC